MSHNTLVKMFKELKNAEVVAETKTPSYNDGGYTVITYWIGDNAQEYRTIYNDWAVEHPDTTLETIKKTTREIEEIVVLSRKKYKYA